MEVTVARTKIDLYWLVSSVDEITDLFSSFLEQWWICSHLLVEYIYWWYWFYNILVSQWFHNYWFHNWVSLNTDRILFNWQLDTEQTICLCLMAVESTGGSHQSWIDFPFFYPKIVLSYICEVRDSGRCDPSKSRYRHHTSR